MDPRRRGAEGGPASERVASSASLPEGIHWVSAGPEALGLAGMWSSKRHMVAVSRTHTASPGPRCGATTHRAVRPCGVIALASVLFCLLDLVPETAAFLTVAPNGACRARRLPSCSAALMLQSACTRVLVSVGRAHKAPVASGYCRLRNAASARISCPPAASLRVERRFSSTPVPSRAVRRMTTGSEGQEERDGRQDGSRVEQAGEPCAAKEGGSPSCPDQAENRPFFSPSTLGSKDFPLDYFGESTRGDLLPVEEMMGTDNFLDAEELNKVCEDFGLDKWGTPKNWGLPANPQRAVFCSRTVNMRSIRCIGYDMDYTLIHYKVTEWEGRAYMYAKENLKKVGFPIEDLIFDAELVCRGLIIDKKLGNIVKVDRFGLVKRAMHGTRRLSIRETHDVYGRQIVDLREGRWLFLNTLFSVSEGCLYAQLVEKLDSGHLVITDSSGAELSRLSYEQLFNAVSKALFKAHVEGRLKADVMTDPARYVELDAELPLTLLDQREAGKKLALITNSDWEYTKVMMSWTTDRFLPEGMTWRDLFDVIIVSSRKPAFFSQTMPLYEIVTEDGMMREKFRMKEGRVYSGGNAGMVEKLFDCDSDDIMYVGDHIFTDVNIAKAYMRWRTALIVREVEEEVIAMDRGRATSQALSALVKRKEQCANILNHLRTELHRYRSTKQSSLFNKESEAGLYDTMARLLSTMVDYDNQIAPMLYQEGSHFNPHWGYLSRAGFNDKSHFMRQIEKYADVYTSRVSNFLRYTPYMYFRSYTHVLAHNRKLDQYRKEVPQTLHKSIDLSNMYPEDRSGREGAGSEEAAAVLLTYSGAVTDVSAGVRPLEKQSESVSGESEEDDEVKALPASHMRAPIRTLAGC